MNDRVFKSPLTFSRTDGKYKDSKTIFLGGGITNCPDWQKLVESWLLENTNLVLFNPRREIWDFKSDDEYSEESKKQIYWEHNHFQMSDAIIFWFSSETFCPIVLFELGKYLPSNKLLFIGADIKYQRRNDVEIQSKIVRPDQIIHSSLESLAKEVMDKNSQGLIKRVS